MDIPFGSLVLKCIQCLFSCKIRFILLNLQNFCLLSCWPKEILRVSFLFKDIVVNHVSSAHVLKYRTLGSLCKEGMMTYPQDTQLSFHLGCRNIFSTIMDCSGPSTLFMSCSARTTLYVWNLEWKRTDALTFVF